MQVLRRDAARNRERILAAAREMLGQGEDLALNAVARSADVGVGTVYRHFATVEELEEVVVWERFDELGRLLDEEGGDRFDQILTDYVGLLVADPLFEKITARELTVLPETASKRAALVGKLADVLEVARSGGTVRDGVDATSVLLLACGAAHSIRSAGLRPGGRTATALLGVILRGLRP